MSTKQSETAERNPYSKTGADRLRKLTCPSCGGECEWNGIRLLLVCQKCGQRTTRESIARIIEEYPAPLVIDCRLPLDSMWRAMSGLPQKADEIDLSSLPMTNAN